MEGEGLLFKKLLKHILQRWNEVLVTQNVDQFMMIKALLSDNGIVTKIKIHNSNNDIGRGRVRESNSRSMYYLLVKTEELGKAKALISKIKR